MPKPGETVYRAYSTTFAYRHPLPWHKLLPAERALWASVEYDLLPLLGRHVGADLYLGVFRLEAEIAATQAFDRARRGSPHLSEVVTLPAGLAGELAMMEDEAEADIERMFAPLRDGNPLDHCEHCGIQRSNCRSGGQWFNVCPLSPVGGNHHWLPASSA